MRAFLWRWCVRIIGPPLRKFGRWLACFIAVSKLLVLCRWRARHLGEYLKKLGKQLVSFGESESGGSWGAAMFDHLPYALLEVNGDFRGAYRGVISAAFFRCSDCGPEKKVVLRLKWIGEPRGQHLENFWDYGEECDIILDPETSPLHVLPDGTLWFMWPTGETGVIRGTFGPTMRKYLRLKSDSEPEKYHKQKESHFNL